MHTPPFVAVSFLALAACSPAHKAEVASAESAAGSAVMSAITPPPGSQAHILGGVDLNKSITLVGTEPFWNILFGDGRLVFSSPDSHLGRTVSAPFILNKDGAEWHDQDMDIYLTPVRCSDGMSDRSYPLKAVVHIGETVLKGCANNTSRLPQNRP
ncbi:MAG: hypothetical protein NVV72_18350 [Asticcacaulis sp.]|nr:hypothetical protein [Asticcacaulis sp.]